jgi:hypothetical protein
MHPLYYIPVLPIANTVVDCDLTALEFGSSPEIMLRIAQLEELMSSRS